MFKVISYKFKPNKEQRNLLRLVYHISKNLYNSALYELRQEYFKSKKIISYYELNKKLKTNENFHIINAYVMHIHLYVLFVMYILYLLIL